MFETVVNGLKWFQNSSKLVELVEIIELVELNELVEFNELVELVEMAEGPGSQTRMSKIKKGQQ